jgi:2-polyprenyl-3-methyl-5-hydroxy-6-metoxy-1,4-benzoquinol methylase
MTQVPNAPSVWDAVWQSQHTTGQELQWNIERDLSIMRWGIFLRFAQEKLGDLSGRSSVELGAGRGIASLQLALLGVRVTLVDWSEQALETAGELYAAFGLQPRLLRADILNLPAAELGMHDISLSVGVAEHFDGPERESVIESHARVLKPGGVSLISVPNSLCVPYRLGKLVAERRGKWKFGVEIPFTHAELTRLAVKAGLDPVGIVGSSFSEATNHFIIQPYMGTILLRLGLRRPASLQPQCQLGEIPSSLFDERESRLDHAMGYLFNLLTVRLNV